MRPLDFADSRIVPRIAVGEASRARRSEVLDPSGARALSLEEATQGAEYSRWTGEGFYDVRRPSGSHELVAVNADRHESDLDVIPQETLALWQNTGQGARAAGAAGAERRSLWISGGT